MAIQCAKLGANVTLVARKKGPLEEAKKEVRLCVYVRGWSGVLCPAGRGANAIVAPSGSLPPTVQRLTQQQTEPNKKTNLQVVAAARVAGYPDSIIEICSVDW